MKWFYRNSSHTYFKKKWDKWILEVDWGEKSKQLQNKIMLAVEIGSFLKYEVPEHIQDYIYGSYGTN